MKKMKTFAYIGMLEALFKLAIVGILYFVSTDKLIVYGILIFVINVSITLSYVGMFQEKYHKFIIMYIGIKLR